MIEPEGRAAAAQHTLSTANHSFRVRQKKERKETVEMRHRRRPHQVSILVFCIPCKR